jgi:hypothetical protein
MCYTILYFICNNGISLAVMTYFVSLKIRFMKNVFSQYIFFALISCEEDVRFNNPSFQGVKIMFSEGCRVDFFIHGSLVIEAYTEMK